MIDKTPKDHPLRRWFCGLVEQAFCCEIGVCDPPLTEYLADLLGAFVHVDQIYRLRSVSGEHIRELSRMEAEAYLGPQSDGTERTRLVNRYIGDFTLFWTGVYPESLQARSGPGRFEAYLAQGKKSYGIASELSPDTGVPSAAVLARLSCEFECCVHGLRLVRSGWQQLNDRLPNN